MPPDQDRIKVGLVCLYHVVILARTAARHHGSRVKSLVSVAPRPSFCTASRVFLRPSDGSGQKGKGRLGTTLDGAEDETRGGSRGAARLLCPSKSLPRCLLLRRVEMTTDGEIGRREISVTTCRGLGDAKELLLQRLGGARFQSVRPAGYKVSWNFG